MDVIDILNDYGSTFNKGLVEKLEKERYKEKHDQAA